MLERLELQPWPIVAAVFLVLTGISLAWDFLTRKSRRDQDGRANS